MTPGTPDQTAIERLARLEVYAEMSRNDHKDLIGRISKMEDRLAKIDDDIRTAKVGGRIIWFIGGLALAVLTVVGGSKFLPFLQIFPR